MAFVATDTNSVDQFWEVVGGSDKGGILVRQEEGLDSQAQRMRLATGSLLKQFRLSGERLQYELLRGAGPASGWVTIRLPGKELVKRVASETNVSPIVAGNVADQPRHSTSSSPRRSSGNTKKTIKCLGLHGGGVNANIMEYQTMAFRRVLGERVKCEWEFLDGPRLWSSQDADDMLKHLSKGKPLRGWYGVDIENDDDRPYIERLMDSSVKFRYTGVDKAVAHVMDTIVEKGPFDVLVGFSQGCIMTHLLAAILRERAQELPWSVSLQFSGMRVRDDDYAKMFDKPLAIPSIQVYGRADPYCEYGRSSQPQMYEQVVTIEHEEGHKFPSTKQKEINARIVNELLRYCPSE